MQWVTIRRGVSNESKRYVNLFTHHLMMSKKEHERLENQNCTENHFEEEYLLNREQK